MFVWLLEVSGSELLVSDDEVVGYEMSGVSELIIYTKQRAHTIIILITIIIPLKLHNSNTCIKKGLNL